MAADSILSSVVAVLGLPALLIIKAAEWRTICSYNCPLALRKVLAKYRRYQFRPACETFGNNIRIPKPTLHSTSKHQIVQQISSFHFVQVQMIVSRSFQQKICYFDADVSISFARTTKYEIYRNFMAYNNT